MLYIPKIKVDQTSQSIHFFQEKKNIQKRRKFQVLICRSLNLHTTQSMKWYFFVLIPYESYSTVKHIFKLVYFIYLFIYFEYKLLVGK